MSVAFSISIAVASVVGALAARRRWRRGVIRARRPEGPTLASLDGARDGAEVTLRGRLLGRRDDAAQAVAVTAVWRGEMRSARDELRVALDVAIEGAVRVLGGSIEGGAGTLGEVEARTLAWLAVLFERPQAEVAARLRGARLLRSGDAVFARGVLRAEPAHDGSAAYREARVRYVLGPRGDAVELTAVEPARSPDVAQSAVGGAVTGVVAALALWLAAGAASVSVLVGSGPRVGTEGARSYIEATGRRWPAPVALASPFHARAAHRALARLENERRRPTRASVSAAIAHAAAGEDCELAVDIARERGRDVEADRVVRAKHCLVGQPERAAALVYAAGRIGDAGELFDPARVWNVHAVAGALEAPSFDLRLHLMGGDESVAATVAVDRAAYIRRWGRVGAGWSTERHAEVVGCIGEALLARGGDGAAVASLRTAAQASTACALLLADALAPDARRLFLGMRPDLADHPVARALAWEAGVAPRAIVPCDERWDALVFDPEAAMAARVPGVEHAAQWQSGYGRSPDDDAWRMRANTRCSLAAFEALAGDDAAARAQAREALALVDAAMRVAPASWQASARDRVRELQVAVEVVAGDDRAAARQAALVFNPTSGLRTLAAFARWRAGEADAAEFLARVPDGDAARGWGRVARDGGAALPPWLHARAWRAVGSWAQWGGFALGPRRAEVADWLDAELPPACVTCPGPQRLVQLRQRQIARRELGARDASAAPIDALAGVLRVRQNAVPLALIDIH